VGCRGSGPTSGLCGGSIAATGLFVAFLPRKKQEKNPSLASQPI